MRMRGGPSPRRKEALVIRFRTAGVVHVVLTIVLGVVSVNSGNNLLCLVTSLLLGYLLASGVAGWRNVMGAEAWAELPDEIYAGRAFRLVVKVRNRRRFASIHMIEVSARPAGEWDGLQEPVRAFFGIVSRGETASRSVWMTKRSTYFLSCNKRVVLFIIRALPRSGLGGQLQFFQNVHGGA